MNRTRAPTRPLFVLVVDGYPDTAASLALILTLEGFAARAAQSVEEALEAAAAGPPDVVVLEPHTPGGGLELVRRLAENVAGERPLLIVLTTDATPAARRAANAAGIDLYLVKPADPAMLVGVLRRFERATVGVTRPVARMHGGGEGIPAIPGECPAGLALAGV
jgi:DNA-binding response OmpR family regulator